jgi:hypothetical protein
VDETRAKLLIRVSERLWWSKTGVL